MVVDGGGPGAGSLIIFMSLFLGQVLTFYRFLYGNNGYSDIFHQKILSCKTLVRVDGSALFLFLWL